MYDSEYDAWICPECQIGFFTFDEFDVHDCIPLFDTDDPAR